MCNLSEGAFEKGRLIGLHRSVCALMDTLHIPIDEAMDILKISSEDRTALKKSLKNDI